MIEEEYISFETAKLAKEKGFDEFCDIGYYIDSGVVDYIRDDYKNMFYPRPTQSLLARWLRENYMLHVESTLFGFVGDHLYDYTYNIVKPGEDLTKDILWFDTYEEAMEAGLKEALSLIESEELNERNKSGSV